MVNVDFPFSTTIAIQLLYAIRCFYAIAITKGYSSKTT